MAEAESFMGGVTQATKPQEAVVPTKTSQNTAVAYVDGSYNIHTKEFSCGAVLFYHGEKKQFSKKYNDKEMAEMRNVAGEIMGAVVVLRYCIEQKIPEIVIYHDYEGVAKWPQKIWKANKKGTQSYVQFFDKVKRHIKIDFVKVKGHSGDEYNDEADILAKKALGMA